MRKVLTVTWVVILFATFLGGIVTAQTVNELQAIVKENIEAANTALDRGNFDLAARLFKLNQVLVPESYEFIRLEANAYAMWGRQVKDAMGADRAREYYEYAADAYMRAIQKASQVKAPKDLIVDLKHQRVMSLIEAQRYDEAINLCVELIEDNNADAIAYYMMGLAIRWRYIDSVERGEPMLSDWVFESNRHFARAISYATNELIICHFFVGVAD